MWPCIVSVIVGLWVMFVPAVFGVPHQTATANYVCGPLFVTFAVIAFWEINRTIIKANIPIAMAFIVWTLLLKPGAAVMTTNVISSIPILACAFVKRKAKQQFGGGWQSLFQKNPQHMADAERPQRLRQEIT